MHHPESLSSSHHRCGCRVSDLDAVVLLRSLGCLPRCLSFLSAAGPAASETYCFLFPFLYFPWDTVELLFSLLAFACYLFLSFLLSQRIVRLRSLPSLSTSLLHIHSLNLEERNIQ